MSMTLSSNNSNFYKATNASANHLNQQRQGAIVTRDTLKALEKEAEKSMGFFTLEEQKIMFPQILKATQDIIDHPSKIKFNIDAAEDQFTLSENRHGVFKVYPLTSEDHPDILTTLTQVHQDLGAYAKRHGLFQVGVPVQPQPESLNEYAAPKLLQAWTETKYD